MWVSKKKLEKLYSMVFDLEIRVASLQEAQKIQCEDEKTRRAFRLLRRAEELDAHYLSRSRYYKALVEAEINQPTMSVRDAVLKIANYLGLVFATEAKIYNNKIEETALIPKDKLKENT